MAKESGKNKFLNFFKVKDLDEDEFDDDLFDDDDDDDDDDYVRPKKKAKQSFGVSRTSQDKPANTFSNTKTGSYTGNSYSDSSYNRQSSSSIYGSGYSNYSSQKAQNRPVSSNDKLVDFNAGRQQRSSIKSSGDVYVIKPQDISESQVVADFLRNGKTIVINMEGLELSPAQRIIDFIGGACYAIGGSLQAISANIFIAAPGSIEVSGDLREEILNESTLSPQLGKY